jgi:type I restriction enzyme S subunit
MPETPWKDCKLDDLVNTNPEALGGSTPPRFRFRYIDINSVTLGKIDWQSVTEVEFRFAPSRARRIVRPGDTMFCTVRPSLHAHAYADWKEPEGFICSTGFAVLRPKQADKRFIFHTVFSEAVALHVRRREVGSSYPAVNESDLKQTPLCVPELEVEQSRIGENLDTLDVAIRETEAVVAKLRQVKAGLLHDLLTRGLDEHGQLRDPDRHPEQFQDSPLGRIPKDWEGASLGNFLCEKPRNGYSPLEAITFEGGYMLGLGCLTREGYRPIQLKNAPMEDSSLARCLLRPGDILVSRSNTRELVAAVGGFPGSSIPTFYPDLMMRLIPTDQVEPQFLELILRHPKVRSQLTNRASGTSGSMVKITSTDVVHAYVSIPKSEEQREILRVADRYSAGIQSEERILDKLRCLKRGLSHDLLTGGVRVKLRC